MALGALIIKEKLEISDRLTVEQSRENSYLQYFIGQSSYSNELPFDPSLLSGLEQNSSPNIAQTCYVYGKYVTIILEPPDKSIRYSRSKS